MIPMLLMCVAMADPVPATDVIDASRYPWQAAVSLPETDGAVRIQVPPDMRRAGEPDDASDMVLIDADGRQVPSAVLRELGGPAVVYARVRPTQDPDTFEISPTDRAVDQLDVALQSGPSAARVWVDEKRDGAWVAVQGPVFIWNHPLLGRQSQVLLAPTLGPLRVRIEHHTARPSRGVHITAAHRARTDARPSSLTLPVIDRRLSEDGDVRYSVPLPHSLPIRSVTPTIDELIFEREARLVGGQGDNYGWDVMGPTATLQRVHLGAVRLDRLEMQVPDEPIHDTLVLDIDSQGRPPLTITDVTVALSGLELLVLDPGNQPLTLLAGAPDGTTPPSDLQVALPELTSMPSVDATVSPMQANSDWTPPEERAGLSAPGSALDLDGFSWSAKVQGTGLSRIALTEHVLAHSRGDRSDLRLIDTQGRQIPHLIRRLPHENDHAVVPFTRTEEDRSSLLRVPVATPNVSVSTVTLHTDAPTFSRQVTLYRAVGAVLDPLRSITWVGEDRPAALAIEVDRVVGEELVIRIDNSDDAPLNVSSVALTWPAWELIAVLPEGGVQLMYGDPHRHEPTYDLMLLTNSLLPRAKAVATLDAPVARTPPPRSTFDEMMLLVGISVLVGGLLMLTVQLVRGVPEGAVEPDPGPEPEPKA